MLVAGGEPNQLGPPGVEPQPERAAPGGAAEMFGDQRAHRHPAAGRPLSRCASRCRRPTARRTAAGCGRGSRPRRASVTSTAAVTWTNIARASGSASAAAATLPISSRAELSGSSSSSAGAPSAVNAGRGSLGGDHPFGHEQLGQPAAQLPAFAGARPRQRVGGHRVAQLGLARVDLGDGDIHPARRWQRRAGGSSDRHLHRG